MTTFLIASGLLLAVVLLLLLTPLLLRERRLRVGSSNELSVAVLRDQLGELEAQRTAGLLDADLFSQEQAELERRALEDGVAAAPSVSVPVSRRPLLAALIGVGLPALAAGLYLWLGEPEALRPQATHDTAGNHALTPQQIQAMAAKLAERLQANPDDGQGWLMLARSYAVLGRYAESSAAFGRATALLPPDANLLADYADVLAMAQGRRLGGEPEKVIARALSVDPRHIKALALSGSAAFERGDFSSAVRDWRAILEQVPPDSSVAQSIKRSIGDAEQRLGGAGSVVQAATGGVAGASVSAFVTGRVVVAPEYAARVAGATLFVFARAVDGSRIPLAMARIDGAKLPYEFRLDDSMSMTPNAKLSGAKSVIVGARLSRSGDALAKPGDLEGFSQPVKVGASGVTVTIGSEVK